MKNKYILEEIMDKGQSDVRGSDQEDNCEYYIIEDDDVENQFQDKFIWREKKLMVRMTMLKNRLQEKIEKPETKINEQLQIHSLTVLKILIDPKQPLSKRKNYKLWSSK